MNHVKPENLSFENLWKRDAGELKSEIKTIWKQYNPTMETARAEERLGQLVFIVKNEFNQVVGISTGYKIYVKQLRNFLYGIRLLVVPEYRLPGLPSKLIVETRNFLESIHKEDTPDPCIGIITLIENDDYKRVRNEAIWGASKMVYIGNSSKGHHIRVYYFKGATI